MVDRSDGWGHCGAVTSEIEMVRRGYAFACFRGHEKGAGAPATAMVRRRRYVRMLS